MDDEVLLAEHFSVFSEGVVSAAKLLLFVLHAQGYRGGTRVQTG